MASVEAAVESGRGAYTAFQAKGYVNVLAVGYTPTPGYRVWLQLRPPDVFPPQYELLWLPPDGAAPLVLTPFQVTTSFRSPEPVNTVTVFDAEGGHEVQVEQIEGRRDLGRKRLNANHFTVAAGSTLVTYTASNLAGQPVLTYNRRAFVGDELEREEINLGTLATVTLQEIVDGSRTTFTLVIPHVQLQPGVAAQVRLPGITATFRSSIAGPPDGQTTVYQVDELVGTADFIVS